MRLDQVSLVHLLKALRLRSLSQERVRYSVSLRDGPYTWSPVIRLNQNEETSLL
uniref:Uncharacterized protein n=1 Tax=Arundo donax TaxID=35708 RepID=A0A0A9CEU5_ARUDO